MNIARVEERLVVVSEEVGVSAYDFDFDLHFECAHPHVFESEELCVLRIGPISDYAAEFNEKLNWGLRLINSPEEHILASELEAWYSRLTDLTPRTRVFDQLPTVGDIEAHFAWPIFLKGSRQTSKHAPELSIIQNRSQYEWAAERYHADPILHWQKPVVREFIPLMPVSGEVPGKINPSVEFRSFWWYGACVGWGRYWYQVPAYDFTDAVEVGLSIAREAADRVNVPFLVVDFAMTRYGDWIVIECNDAQESGYAAIPPHALWRQVLDRIRH